MDDLAVGPGDDIDLEAPLDSFSWDPRLRSRRLARILPDHEITQISQTTKQRSAYNATSIRPPAPRRQHPKSIALLSSKA